MVSDSNTWKYGHMRTLAYVHTDEACGVSIPWIHSAIIWFWDRGYYTIIHYRGSHLRVACGSVCDWNQNQIKWSFFCSWKFSIHVQSSSWSLEQLHKGGVAMILYLERRKYDQVSERNNQAIEDDFTNQDFQSWLQMLLRAIGQGLPLRQTKLIWS